MALANAQPQFLAAIPEWFAGSLPWIVLASLFVLIALAVGVWVLVSQVSRLQRLSSGVDRLEDLRQAVSRMADDTKGLDLRRIEHVLLEIRDLERRVEDGLMRVVERNSGSAALGGPSTGASVSERVVNRLLAMGYDRVKVLGDSESLQGIGAGPGEVRVEAYRNGVLCKGRVLVREGALIEVELRTAHSVFP